jgi:hypothetical protein
VTGAVELKRPRRRDGAKAEAKKRRITDNPLLRVFLRDFAPSRLILILNAGGREVAAPTSAAAGFLVDEKALWLDGMQFAVHGKAFSTHGAEFFHDRKRFSAYRMAFPVHRKQFSHDQKQFSHDRK